MIKVLSQFTEKTLDNRTATGKSTGTDARINSKVFRVPTLEEKCRGRREERRLHRPRKQTQVAPCMTWAWGKP